MAGSYWPSREHRLLQKENAQLTESSVRPSNEKEPVHAMHRTTSGSESLNRSLSEIWLSNVKNSFSATSLDPVVAYLFGSRPRHSANRLRSVPSMDSHRRKIGCKICVSR